MGFLSGLRSALGSVLSGKKRRREDEDGDAPPPPVPEPESAARPARHHQLPAQRQQQQQQPYRNPAVTAIAGPQQRLDFSSPVVNAQQRRAAAAPGGRARVAGGLMQQQQQQQQPTQQQQLPVALPGRSSSWEEVPISQPAPPMAWKAAAVPLPPVGQGAASLPPVSQGAAFTKCFAAPKSRATPAKQGPAPLLNAVRRVREQPLSATKMDITPGALQRQPSGSQAGWRPAAALGQVHGTFTGGKAAAGQGRQAPWHEHERRRRESQQREVERAAGSIELQPFFGASSQQHGGGGLVRTTDAEVLRRAVQREVEEQAQHEQEHAAAAAAAAAGQAEEVDLTGEPSSSQQPSQSQQQPQQPLWAVPPRQQAWAAPGAAGLAAAAAAPAERRFDWRLMLERLQADQDGLADLESDRAPERAAPVDLGDDEYLRLAAAADFAKKRALQLQETEVQFAQQLHTALERGQPQRAAAAEAEALKIEAQLKQLQLEKRQAESRRRLQAQAQQVQQQRPPSAAAAAAAAAARNAVEMAAAEEEEIILLSSEEEEEQEEQEGVELSSSEAEEEEEEEEEEVSEQLERVELRDKRVALPPILDEWRDEYDAALAPGDPHEVLVAHSRSSISIRRRDMACMASLQWLNDEVINLYISLLLERDAARRTQGAGGPRCHFFSTFFANKLYKDGGYDYNAVRRWTTPKRLAASGQASECILDCDRIVVPVHQGLHWVCAVVDLQRRALVYYDSLQGEDHRCLEQLARYVHDEFKNKREEERPDVLSWRREFPKDIPRQLNGCDCGVFTLLFARYAGRGTAMDFRQEHIDDFRVRIVHELLQLSIDG